MIWYGSVLFLSVLLLGYLIYREYIRPNRSNRILRILAAAFSIIAICLSILPLTYSTTRKKGKAIVLTLGYSKDSLSQFLSGNRNCCSLFSYNHVAQDSSVYYTGDIQMLVDSLDQYMQVDVFGYGFSRDDHIRLNNPSLIFHSSPPPSGFRSSSWTEQIRSGEPLVVQGQFYSPASNNVKITLSIASAVTDSLMIDSSEGPFMLQTIPRHIGRATYFLTMYDGQDIIETNEIPVEVIPAEQVRILILASAPNFETRFLKDWLYNAGNSLVVRTAISRNKTDYQYLNSSRVNADRITEKLLRSFDLLVIDVGELNRMNRGEMQVMINAIESGRTGIIIRADQSIQSNNILSSGISVSPARSGKQIIQARLEDYGDLLPGIEVEDPIFIRASASIKPLVSSTSSILAASALKGSGKIVFTSLNNSYFWSMTGHQTEYSSYWRTLLSEALPISKSKMNVGFGMDRPRVNEPASLKARFPESKNPDISIDGVRIALRQNYVLDDEWMGTWWPVKTGWVKLSSANSDTSVWRYVYLESSYQTEDAWKKIAAGTARAKLEKNKLNEPINQLTVVNQPVPAIIYYLVFLLCAGYLWLEKKLAGEV